jgi:N-acetylglucosaminyl-diphospho-decaprenol L-rhamnosyltransferase
VSAVARTLTVQIVNYRTRAHLERCLESVVADLTASGLDHEIRLLDNASGEPLDDLARRHAHVIACTAERNLGFGAGHNRLAADGDARYLWILNPDAEIVEADTAIRLIAALEEDAAVQAVGPRLLCADGTPQPYDHGRLNGPRARLALRGGHSYWRATNARRRVAWVSGAAVMLERAAFAALGGFDERFFLYKEEEDLCVRLRAGGGAVLYEPSVSVRHVGAVVAGQPRWAAESERYFIAKHCRAGAVQRASAAAHQMLAYVHL